MGDYLNEITATKSRLAQIDILSKYKEDEDIKYYLNFLLNPYIVTGIPQKKLNKMVALDANGFTEVYDILEYIKVNNTGRDYDIAKVNYTRSFLPIELKDLYDKIITKNLPLGIDVKTVNKVIPGLIPEFKVMLANKYFNNPKVIEGKTFVLTTKIDGMRCIMLKENGEVTFWSRQGQKIEGLVDLEKKAVKVFPDDICLDGELIAKETLKRRYL